ncbi:hypothetical protein BS47DRAFT_1483463 [Hydnum rufescens UP504]|uniref:non-specific serine/threonine protein kinase n=1 Tax=Hydnum rufescens UP504 TaxID=1448309 RepID=A0A9P6DXB6_9AGAM|nr:hypothetical protein BS47DRAFT_1483463 [Hydnum rufescens UP504]
MASTVANYQLGDLLGKGAFGQVYRALNWTTGETVAVKQIQLANIPKAELGDIMSEIDLLKNLNHVNIVKYKGFVKTREYLYIILEYCENGSLHNICKRFGKFPENLVAVYISQVLEGLVYLHDQGVIHRDIKGANILTNKDGGVKLADFGVATTPTGAINDATVVGSPYWMAPEVIEQSGATTASDIWSVGCVVIELLEGKPPYHFLDPMPALFRIVQDDCPPIPEGASPIVKDFLYHCFQKDCNLRISAKKLLKHPWMASARKQLGNEKASGERTLSNFDEAVQRVQEWNEALKSPSRASKQSVRDARLDHRDRRIVSPTMALSHSLTPSNSHGNGLLKFGISSAVIPAAAPLTLVDKLSHIQPVALQQPEEVTDNWDDDFEGGIPITKLQSLDKSSIEEERPDADDNARTIRPSRSPSAHGSLSRQSTSMAPIVEDYSDLAGEDEDFHLQAKVADFKMKNSVRKSLYHPDDIKTVGLAQPTPRSRSGPSPSTSTSFTISPTVTPSGSLASRSHSARPTIPPITPPTGAHSRSLSLGSGSLGRSEAQRLHAQSELGRYIEDEDEDYEDVFAQPSDPGECLCFAIVDIHLKVHGHPVVTSSAGQTLQLNTRLSSKSWLGDEDSDEDDPFAEASLLSFSIDFIYLSIPQIDEGFVENDLEANLIRDKYARLCTLVNQLVDQLLPTAPDYTLRDVCNQLLVIMTDTPEMQFQLVSSHGLLAILEVLESKPSRDVVMNLLKLTNLLVTADLGVLESFCLIGGIPVVMTFTSKKYSSECRFEASNFVRLLCHSSILTLQMFISCRGLKVLVELLDEDYSEQADLVAHALNGVGSVFELQSPTPKNDFCRMFIREGLLDPLTSALLSVMNGKADASAEMKFKILQILLVFCQVSQSDNHVRLALGTRKIVRRLLRACEVLEPEHLVIMLKAVKHLSMNPPLLDVLQNANAIEILIRILEAQGSGPHSAESSNHIFQTCFNLCRLNKSRQEEAAQAGIIPCLKRVIDTNSPLKQFALPILCDLASAGKSCRTLLWQHDGLHLYLELLADPYFQVSALEAILFWLQDETARVEDVVAQKHALEKLISCFVNAKANSFENLLDPFLKICRMSSSVVMAIAKSSPFFRKLVDRLSHSKAVVRLNLLRILRAVCDVTPDRAALVERYGFYDIVTRLSQKDGAVLVRELARDIIPVLLAGSPNNANKESTSLVPSGNGGIAPRKRTSRRTASETSAHMISPPLDKSVPTQTGRRLKPVVRNKLSEIPWKTDGHEG